MTFEKTLKIISATIAVVIIYVFLGGMYLSVKGFVSDGNGSFVLGQANNSMVKDAFADEISQIKTKNNELLEDKVLGDKNAPVTIYEVSSYSCSHCATFNQATLPLIEKNYIETKKANLVHVDFPFEGKAMAGSMITNCTNDVKKYYKLVSLIFKNQKQWSVSYNTKELFVNYAKQVGISEKEAYKCLEDRDLVQKIANKKAYFAETYNINATPSFVISNGKDFEIIRGAQPYQVFVAAIDKISKK